MIFLLISLVVIYLNCFRVVTNACRDDSHRSDLVIAVGTFLSDSSDKGANWEPTERKGTMKFNDVTCQYEKTVNGLPVNRDYEWKVTFNMVWNGDKGCNNQNCRFNSGPSGTVLLIYNSYTDRLSTDSVINSLGDKRFKSHQFFLLLLTSLLMLIY